MCAVTSFAKAAGEKSARAYGRFFAYRIGSLKGFTWNEDGGLDDLQLLNFIVTNSVPCQSVWTATVNVTPAGNYRDFHYQTTKWRLAAPQAIREKTRLRFWLAPMRVAAKHPHWAVAYVVARIAAIIQHKMNPVASGQNWVPPKSTKTPLDD
jgi:hypothetical protein